MDGRGVRLEGGEGVGDRLEDLVLDVDERGGGAGLAARARGHGGEDVADVAGRLALGHEGRPVAGDQALDALAGDVGGGHDGDDAGRRGSAGRVDPADDGPRVVGQAQGGVEHARGRHVGDERLLAEGHLPGADPVGTGADAAAGRGRRRAGARRAGPPRPPRSRRRSSRSRCSGRGCRRATGRSRRARAPGRARRRPSAFMTIPGEQKPHWLAPDEVNAAAQADRASAGQPLERDDLAAGDLARRRARTTRPGVRRRGPCRRRTSPRGRSRPSSSAARSPRGGPRGAMPPCSTSTETGSPFSVKSIVCAPVPWGGPTGPTDDARRWANLAGFASAGRRAVRPEVAPEPARMTSGARRAAAAPGGAAHGGSPGHRRRSTGSRTSGPSSAIARPGPSCRRSPSSSTRRRSRRRPGRPSPASIPTPPTRGTSSASTGTTRPTAAAFAAVPEHVVLPPSFTGVEAPIVVALGDRFPMIAAHKVLAAYACLVPRLVTGAVRPDDPARRLAVDRQLLPRRRGDLADPRLPRRGRPPRGDEPGALRLARALGGRARATSSGRPAPRATSRRSTTPAPSSRRTRPTSSSTSSASSGTTSSTDR